MYLGFVYFYTLLNFLSLLTGSNEELCFVSIVFRHGDRAPFLPYPTDPYSDPSLWPNGWGQLTKMGKLQHYELGKWIRYRYWDFLPLKYNASDIYVLSTDVDRTLVSAYCNLAGLYECWNEAQSDVLPWQHIPVHTVPLEMDSVLSVSKKCPVYEKYLQNAMATEEVRSMNEMYRDVFSNLSCLTGMDIKTVRDCVSLYGTLNAENLHGFQLPEWTSQYFPQPLKEIAEFAVKIPCSTTPMKRLKCGPLLKNIIQNMQKKQQGMISQKMWIYSGHDVTLINLMQCLGVYDGIIPTYTATLIFEMSKQDDEYFVSISYKTPTTFMTLKLPCCKNPCPLQDLESILRPVTPVDWEKPQFAFRTERNMLLTDHVFLSKGGFR